ncbi:MAG: TolB family protein [Gammaproteobacteria bacterium]
MKQIISMVLMLALMLVSAGTIAAGDQIDTVILKKNSDIYLSVGSGPMVRLTHDGIPKSYPRFSKDGSMIAFIEKSDRAALDMILVINRQGRELYRVYIHPEQAVGAQAADSGFGGMRYVEEMEWLNNSRIVVGGDINPSTSENLIYDLPPHGLPEEFNPEGGETYSPDGKHFAYEDGMPHFTPADEQMPTLNVDNKAVYPTSHSQITFISAPRWSPDSRMLGVLVRDSHSGSLKLVIWHVGGTVTTALMPTTGASLALLPDANTSAYHADVYYANGGWVVKSIGQGGMSPTGQAEVSTTGQGGAWQLSADGQSFQPLQGAAPPDPMVAARALRQKLERDARVSGAYYGMDFWCKSCALLALPE